MAQKKAPRGRSFTFSFSPAGLFALLLFAIIALAWAFIFGLLLGRGYQPEELVPEIAGIMPTPPPPPVNINESLRAEDLDFYEQLKKLPVKEDPVEAKAKQPMQAPRPEVKIPKNIAMEKKSKEKPPLAVRPKTTSAAQEPGKKEPIKQETKKKVPTFLYHYQIASLADGATALGVQKRLEAKGITASTAKVNIKGKSWYRIIVEVRGNEQDVKATAAKLKKEGFPDMILSGKKRMNE